MSTDSDRLVPFKRTVALDENDAARSRFEYSLSVARRHRPDSFDATIREGLPTRTSKTTPLRVSDSPPQVITKHSALRSSYGSGARGSDFDEFTNMSKGNYNPRSSIGNDGIFQSTIREETPVGRQKRAREDYSTREEIENQIQREDSKVASAGRWLLSKLSRIPIVGSLISPTTSPKGKKSTNDTRDFMSSVELKQDKHEDAQRRIQPDTRTHISVDAMNRRLQAETNSPLESRLFTTERRRQQLEYGMIKDDDGTLRPMTDQERRIVADLPVYSTPEEERADLEYIMKLRRLCESHFRRLRPFLTDLSSENSLLMWTGL